VPIIEQSNGLGDALGGLFGAAGAFINGQQQAKQQKYEQARQAAKDAQLIAETMYQHQEDAKRDTLAETKAGQEATTFSNQQTDRAQAEATATALAHFQARMKYPANWNKMKPEQQIAYLQQRLNKEQQMPGAEKLVAQTQKEIEDIQRPLIAAANQAAATGRTGMTTATQRRDTDVREQGATTRLDIRLSDPRRGGGGDPDLSDRGTAVYNRAIGAQNQQAALKIVESSGLSAKEEARVRRNVIDQFREPAPRDLSGLSVKGNNDLKHDMELWTIGGMDPTTMPDPNNPKYEKKINVVGSGNRSAPAPAATPAAGAKPRVETTQHNGKTYYKHPDGNWYLAPP
jgi:hypothetical protein